MEIDLIGIFFHGLFEEFLLAGAHVLVHYVVVLARFKKWLLSEEY